MSYKINRENELKNMITPQNMNGDFESFWKNAVKEKIHTIFFSKAIEKNAKIGYTIIW